MTNETPEMMTITELAVFLRLPLSSVYKLAQQGKIPGQKVGRHWRFYRPAIVRWVGREGGTRQIEQSLIPIEN